MYTELLKRCQRDPAYFVSKVLGHTLWPGQVDIMTAVRDHPRVAVRSCHGAGKTFTAADIVLWFLLTHPSSIVATTAPSFRQVSKILWQGIARAHLRSRLPLGGELLQTEYKIAPGWFAFGFSTTSSDAFQGLHAADILVVLDEASGIPPEIWVGAEGVLSSHRARLLTIGNPTDPLGQFAKEHTMPGTRTIKISAFDTPNFTTFGITLDDIRNSIWEAKILGELPYPALTTPAWVADKFKRWGEDSPLWRARVLGDFPDISDDTLIPLHWIERAQNNIMTPGADHELAVDVARYGDDESVIYERRGSRARVHSFYRQLDTMELTGRIVKALRETGASRVKVDVIGIGAGVVDRLKELKLPVRAINFAEKATDADKFANTRAECFWQLRQRFEVSDIDIDATDDDLTSQLANIKYFINSRGCVQIESKDDMKRRGLSSPDRADALAMAMSEISKRSLRAGTWGRGDGTARAQTP